MSGRDEPLPRARLADVLRGRAPVVGSRFDGVERRGLVSPVEARLLMGIPYGDLAADERAYLRAVERSLRSDAGVLARAAFARALAPPGGARPEDRPRIVSATVDNVTIDRAVAAIFEPPPTDRARMVCFVHPHALNLATFDRDFALLLADADLVLPDGIGVRIAAALLGVAMRHNLNGTDLLPLLCDAAVAERVPLALIGAAEGVAEACAENLRRDHPGLQTPVVHHGYLDDAASGSIAEQVGQLGRALVLVGMGSPRQERWAREHLAGVGGITVITVGGLFDFFSGRIQRAPVAWREMGLEWAWRLRQEPGRLARRYLLGNPLFLALALAQRAGLR